MKTSEALGMELGDDALGHQVETLGHEGLCSGVLREGFLFAQRLSGPFVGHRRIVDAAAFFKQPLTPFAEPVQQRSWRNPAKLADCPKILLVKKIFALGADAWNCSYGERIEKALDKLRRNHRQ